MSGETDFTNFLRTAREAAVHPTGTPGYLSPESLLAALGTVRQGESVSLARPLSASVGQEIAHDGRPKMNFQRHVREDGPVSIATDRLDVWCHGMSFTHLDGPDHMALDGDFFGPDKVTGQEQGHTAGPLWSRTGLIGRGVLVDVPRARGEAYVTADAPVTADEIDRILGERGTSFEEGDALLLYCGRDALEADLLRSEPVDAAIAQDVAVWVHERRVSVLCWDVLDAPREHSIDMGPHLLNWAVGLAIVDNCDFGNAVARMRELDRDDGLLIVAPLPMDGATGCLVNPLLVL